MAFSNPAAEKKPNLWAQAFSNYWSDPANVIGPPGALVRRAFKFIWLVLSIYVLFWIAGPSQVASWRLWMEDDQLAEHIAWGFTLASALCFAVVGYAAEASEPMRVPLLMPSIEFEEKKYKGWRIKPVHLHLPALRVLFGGILCAGLFSIALLGMYNFYLHEQQTAGGASVAAISGSTDRVAEAERALNEHDASVVAALAIVDQGIRETSAGSPTGRSRLVRQRTELMTEAAATRRDLQAELREARAATVTTHQTFSDPRPVDGQVAGATGIERGVIASLLDLLRSGVVEALLVMGAALGVAGSTSRIGVPAGGDVSRETKPEVETVAATAAVTSDEPPPQPTKRRFTLPHAMEADYAQAAAVGPQTAAAPETPPETEPAAPPEPVDEPAATEGAPEETPAGGDPEPIAAEGTETAEPQIDPLFAEHLSQPDAERENV